MDRVQWDLMRMRQQRKWAERKEKFAEKYEGVSPWQSMTALMDMATSMVPPQLNAGPMGIPQLPQGQGLPPGPEFQQEIPSGSPVPGMPPPL